MRFLLRRLSWTSAVCGLILVPMAAAGPITIITTSSAFPANDSVAWVPNANNHLFAQPIVNTSADGIAVTGTLGGPASILVEMPCGNGTLGSDFAPCAYVLDNNGYGALTLSLATPIAGMGAQFDAGGFQGTFTAEMSAYDGSTLLGTVSETGNANRNEDNSAMFLGFTSSTPVTSVSLDTNSSAFDVGALSLDDTLPLDPVPEPPSWALAGAGLLLLCGLSLRRRRLQP